MTQVVVGHEDVGVAPSVVRVGGTRQAVDIVAFAPRQLDFVQRDYQAVKATGVGVKNNAFQSVVMEIIPDVINWVDMMGQEGVAA